MERAKCSWRADLKMLMKLNRNINTSPLGQIISNCCCKMVHCVQELELTCVQRLTIDSNMQAAYCISVPYFCSATEISCSEKKMW